MAHDIIYAKIPNDSNRYKFAMTQNARKDVGIVTFDLTAWFTCYQSELLLIYYSGILEFMRKTSMLTLK